MANTKPLASQVKYHNTNLLETTKDTVLKYDLYSDAVTAALSLPNGQKISTYNEDGELIEYTVSSGVLTQAKDFDIVYKQDSLSAVPRTAKQYFRENWTINDFKQDFSGWTEAFQKIASETDAGLHIKLLDNTYTIETAIAFARNNMKLIGYGPDHSIIKRPSGTPITDSLFTLVGGSSGQVLEGFMLDGSAASNATLASGLRLSSDNGGVVNATLRNLFFKDWGGGDRYTDFAAGVHAYGAKKLRASMLQSSGNNHYGSNFYECEDLLVSMCQSWGDGKHGFGAAGTKVAKFIGLKAKDPGMNGFWFRALQDTDIIGCSVFFTNPTQQEIASGLQLKGVIQGSITGLKNVNVVGFSCTGARSVVDSLNPLNGSAGISLSIDSGATSENVTITGGGIDGGYMGIKMLNGDSYKLSDMTVSNTIDRPIYDAGTQDTQISDMKIYDCARGSYTRGRNTKISDWKVRSKKLAVGETHYALTIDDTFGGVYSDIVASSSGGTLPFTATINLTGNLSNTKVYDIGLMSASAPPVLNNSVTPTNIRVWDTYNSSNVGPTANVRYTERLMLGTDDTAPGIYVGSGSPEGVVQARPGSIYLRTDASSDIPSLYKKSQFQSNTGWVAS